MSDFDDAIREMDAVTADTFGDEASLSAGGQSHPVQVIIDRDVVSFGPNGRVVQTHLSIPEPPIPLANGQTVMVTATGEVFTLREDIEDDGFMPVWAVTKNP